MHNIILSLLMIAILVWFLFPKQLKNVEVLVVPVEEMYKNEPSQIQFTNAEFKFYK